jgi:hypothetical protein
MKMQCSALPFGVWTGVLFAKRGAALKAAAEERKERRFMKREYQVSGSKFQAMAATG